MDDVESETKIIERDVVVEIEGVIDRLVDKEGAKVAILNDDIKR